MGGESEDQGGDGGDNNGVLAVDETTSPKNEVKLLLVQPWREDPP